MCVHCTPRIPHEVELQAVLHFLSFDSDINSRQSQFILTVTRFCLEHYYFNFEDDYLQKTGTAMGEDFAPSYANLMMGLWEQNLLEAHLVFYWRYIDIIWDGPLHTVQKFLLRCNSNTFGRFTSEIPPLWHNCTRLEDYNAL